MALFAGGSTLVKALSLNTLRGKLACRTTTNYKFLPPFEPTTKAEFEVTKNPEEWKYVERLLPPRLVPTPKPRTVYTSGWTPQNASADQPYFIVRTKNHMTPVYLGVSKRGMRKITTVKRIRGNVWELESELRRHLRERAGHEVGMRVDEVGGNIFIRGDYVSYVNEWMKEKGF